MPIKKSVRLMDETVKLCGELSPKDSINFSGAINAMSEQYNLFVGSCLPELTESETMAFYSAFNGHTAHPDINQEIRLLSSNMSESFQCGSQINDLFTDEEIVSFIARIRTWSIAEKLAVIYMANSYWRKAPVVDGE